MRRTLNVRFFALPRLLGALLLSVLCLVSTRAAAAPLRIVTSLPDLGSLAQAVGGDAVVVAVLARPTEDPHFVEAKPSFVKALSDADLYVQNGLGLEDGYGPVLLQQARNPRLTPGQPGFVDASRAITPVDVPVGQIDRSMGDVHPFGNPHYLLDPLNGLAVAALLRDRLSALRPEQAAAFAANYDAFRQRLFAALVGEALAGRYDGGKLATLAEHGKLQSFLAQQGEAGLLGGWLGAMAPYAGSKAVDDHPLWAYFARRFGLLIVGHLEPKPGIPPTSRHLQELVARMRSDGVRLILANAYYDPRHADFVASETGARVARLANQVGARPDTDDYLAMTDYNVRQVVAALAVP